MPQTILFIEPRGVTNTFSRFMGTPLLGPVYLATMANQAGYDARVLNENILRRQVSEDELAEADQICLTCLTATVERGIEIAQRYRAVRAARGLPAKAHIGGIHASMQPEELVPHFDHVAVGEGEAILLDLLAGRFDETIVHGQPVQDLDMVPIPDFSLVKGWNPNGLRPVMTSRGCPFDCNFCSVTTMFGKGYRTASPERVVEETKQYQSGAVFYVDDNFAANMKRTRRILDLMEEHKLKVNWTTQVRTDLTRHPDVVRRMRERGCEWVFVGFESVNPESLKDMQKGQTVEDIRRAIRVFREASIRVHGMFMFGADPDTTDVFKMTADFALDCGIDTVQYNVLTPLPGTRLWDRIVSEGRLLHKKWRYYDGLHVVFHPKNMSPAELQQGMMTCFGDFYTYGRAVTDAFVTGCKAVNAWVQRLAAIPAQFPTFYGTLIKFVGRGIVKSWLRENVAYVRSLPR